MTGIEWVVEAHGCEPQSLTEMRRLRALFSQMVKDLSLRPVGETQWHQFAATPLSQQPGGITGLCLLAESHLAVHTFPEHGSLCLNLFCCKPRPQWDFHGYLKQHFAANTVNIRKLERDYFSASGLRAFAKGAS